MNDFHSKCIHIFVHIPMTGGQTLRNHFIKNMTFHKNFIHLGPFGENDEKAKGLIPFASRSKNERREAQVILGHNTYLGIHELVPNRIPRYITFFREPAAHIVSQYNFAMSFLSRDGKPIVPFEEWILSAGKNHMTNWFVSNFLRVTNPNLSDDQKFQIVELSLSKFWFVGATENLDEQAPMILNEIGLPSAMERRNVTGKDIERILSLSDELRTRLNRENHLDYVIYNRWKHAQFNTHNICFQETIPPVISSSKPKAFVLIHQMGKVGSQSIETSIRASSPGATVERHHYLGPGNLNRCRRMLSGTNANAESLASVRYQTELAEKYLNFLQTYRGDYPLHIFTGFRDPLDHAIAGYFQNLEALYPHKGISQLTPDDVPSVRKHFSSLVQDCIDGVENSDYAHQLAILILRGCIFWFDDDFLAIHGIDIYEYPFPKNGMLQISKDSVSYTFYKMEKLAENLAHIVKSAPLFERCVIENKNQASKKNYYTVYEEFRRTFVPTAEMYNYFYDNKYFRHFYANEVPRYTRVETL